MRRLARIAVIDVAPLLFASFVTAVPASPMLSVVAGRRLVWSAPIDAGEAFDIAFVHSQERTPWVQHYVAGADRSVWQVASTFRSYGAGMPAGLVHRSTEGFTVWDRRRIAVVRMLNSRTAHLTLSYRGQALTIDRWFDDYEAFEIRIQ